jgi:hypothetical protein
MVTCVLYVCIWNYLVSKQRSGWGRSHVCLVASSSNASKPNYLTQEDADVPILQTYSARFFMTISTFFITQTSSSSAAPLCTVLRFSKIMDCPAFGELEMHDRLACPGHQRLGAKSVRRVVRPLGFWLLMPRCYDQKEVMAAWRSTLFLMKCISRYSAAPIACMITGSRPWRDYLQSFTFKLSCPIFMV